MCTAVLCGQQPQTGNNPNAQLQQNGYNVYKAILDNNENKQTMTT